MQQGAAAKKASALTALAKTDLKNKALHAVAESIEKRSDEWLAANAADIKAAEESGMSTSMLDRLRLTPERISDVADGVRHVAALPDPIGDVLRTEVRPNGLQIKRVRVPLGVIGIIYEARPNVTVDAAALCLKAGSACILRGGKEAINSNRCVVEIMREAISSVGLPENSVSLVQDTSRESASELMAMTEYVDVLIPRGGASLIRAVAANSKVPVIRTGEGVCHVYIDKDADLSMGAEILYNAKCSRPSVCNAAECVLVHEDVIKDFFKEALPLLDQKNVVLRADEKALAVLGDRAVPATDEDWDTEYGDFILAVKTVSGPEEACDFISKHGTGHSEAIVTENAETADRFLQAVDAAAVYVNASTRFTDGGEFGMGAEIGISTQKLHARGPMGLEEMTSYKYVITGKGQVR
jgi:glutamate-5-semialdehyde dehydrogenase